MQDKTYIKVLEYIKRKLFQKEMGAGDRLPTERDLSAQLGIGRNSIREALRMLENMGVLECRQGSGNYLICNMEKIFTESLSMMLLMDQVDHIEICQVRRISESEAFLLAMKRIRKPEIREMEQILRQMEQASDQNTGPLDLRFHSLITQASGNNLLDNIMRSFGAICQKQINYVLKQISHEARTALDTCHRDIFEALVTDDPKKGTEAITRHYDILEKGLTEQPEIKLRAFYLEF